MDEHSVTVVAPREAVWKAVRQYARGLTRSDHGLIGTVLGTEPRSGFEVSQEIEGERLALSGRHRFARYRLVFALTEQPDRALKLSAISYAVFPGARGRLYRAVLLGSGGHVLAVRHMLRTISRRA
jgi:hypothetical protein